MNAILKFVSLSFAALVILSFILIASGVVSFNNFFKPVSVVSKVLVDGELKKTDGKTNILLLGVDSRGADSSIHTSLTDTIIVASLDSATGNVTMISIPRDLWVEDYREKINAVYALSKKDVGEVKKVVEGVVGIPIHYYAIVGFDVFTDSIEAVGGITIDVENTFDDYTYPIEGRENVLPESSRYEHIHFDAGVQEMDGETALKFARSRHALGPEGGDFSRARRQQKVILAIKDKVLSSETFFNPAKLTSLYDAFSSNVKTDLDAGDIVLFYKNYKDVEFDTIEKIILSNEIVNSSGENQSLGADTLMAPDEETRAQFYSGKYVLVPKSGSYEEIHALIRSSLFK